MHKLTYKLLLACLIMLTVNSCAKKYIHPTTAQGKECVALADRATGICVDDLRDEEYSCMQRNDERSNIQNQQKQRQRQYKNNYRPGDDYNPPPVNRINREYCGGSRDECYRQFRRRFVACGGRIE